VAGNFKTIQHAWLHTSVTVVCCRLLEVVQVNEALVLFRALARIFRDLTALNITAEVCFRRPFGGVKEVK
jgi:hypothetical protein